MTDLKGKNIIVTGASGGIGNSIVEKLNQAGANILASGTRIEKLEELKNKYTNIQILKFDISNIDKIEEFVEEASRELGGNLDCLVNNAGITQDNLAIRMSLKEWQKVIDINLTATFLNSKFAIKKMLRHKSGKIVNITSVVGHTGNLGQANYTASKAGIIAMSKSLAIEYAKKNININCISPGFIKTTMTEKLLLFGNAISVAGTVKARKAARHATSDWMQMEQERGISVTTSVMQFPYKDRVVNLLDTPGHEDFSEDTYRTLTAVDSALMVLDGAKGVEDRTIKLMQVCRLRTTPIISSPGFRLLVTSRPKASVTTSSQNESTTSWCTSASKSAVRTPSMASRTFDSLIRPRPDRFRRLLPTRSVSISNISRDRLRHRGGFQGPRSRLEPKGRWPTCLR